MRIVIDANVFASGLLKPSSPPGEVFKYVCTYASCELVLSAEIVEEVRRILKYPKLQKYLKRTEKEIDEWIEALAAIAFFVSPQFTYPVIVKDDPDDDNYVIAALESRARILISGDKHLLNLHQYENVKIMTPAEFLFNHFTKK